MNPKKKRNRNVCRVRVLRGGSGADVCIFSFPGNSVGVMTIIGIDPGKSGGVALLFPTGPVALKMLETLTDLIEEIESYTHNEEQVTCYIEQVHAMPKQGVSSTFTFGRNFGGIEGVLTALKIRREYVTPQRWQKALGCLSKGDKNVTKRKAQELFPELKITHATADALLIAEYGRRAETR